MIEFIPLLATDVILLLIMVAASLISVAALSRSKNMPERISAATSFGSKIALMIIAFGIFREDSMIGSIGAIILISGDAGMVLLTLTELQD